MSLTWRIVIYVIVAIAVVACVAHNLAPVV